MVGLWQFAGWQIDLLLIIPTDYFDPLVLASESRGYRLSSRNVQKVSRALTTNCLAADEVMYDGSFFPSLRFDNECVSGVTQLKSSVQKGIRNKILEQYPSIEEHVENILPKKDSLKIIKCQNHIEILVNGAGEHLFFKQRDDIYFPSLRLIHKCRYPISYGIDLTYCNVHLIPFLL